jgi:hypothetical protein
VTAFAPIALSFAVVVGAARAAVLQRWPALRLLVWLAKFRLLRHLLLWLAKFHLLRRLLTSVAHLLGANGEVDSASEPLPEPDWSEQAYQGGPMVKVRGFPRPLYPPDASRYGKRPSVDGPDVEAYKRTVARAGRWPWQTFDESFSNGFSHGTPSGSADETGIAGVQRQQHLDATGWVGKQTFDTLRSIRVPAHLPHAGEMAMDAYAASLIDEAYERFGGSEPEPNVTDETIRAAALELAISELGYSEYPAGSNLTKYGAWYGVDGQPWCAIFVTWCDVGAAEDLQLSSALERGARYAYVPYVVADARAGLYGLSTTDDPIPGDLVCYDWSFDGVYDHIGRFEHWLDGGNTFTAIEGNTSSASNSNGGEVQRRERTRSGQGTVFVHIRE